jgi:hypothetical protein
MPSPSYKISTKSTDRFKSRAHLRSLNVRHFEMVETGFNSMEPKLSSMLLPPYKISYKSTKHFKSY